MKEPQKSLRSLRNTISWVQAISTISLSSQIRTRGLPTTLMDQRMSSSASKTLTKAKKPIKELAASPWISHWAIFLTIALASSALTQFRKTSSITSIKTIHQAVSETTPKAMTINRLILQRYRTRSKTTRCGRRWCGRVKRSSIMNSKDSNYLLQTLNSGSTRPQLEIGRIWRFPSDREISTAPRKSSRSPQTVQTCIELRPTQLKVAPIRKASLHTGHLTNARRPEEYQRNQARRRASRVTHATWSRGRICFWISSRASKKVPAKITERTRSITRRRAAKSPKEQSATTTSTRLRLDTGSPLRRCFICLSPKVIATSKSL